MSLIFGRPRLRLIAALGLVATQCFAAPTPDTANPGAAPFDAAPPGTALLATAPLDAMRGCAATASPVLSGIEKLGAVCPELRTALGTLGLDEILYEGWHEKLNVHTLNDVLELGERYSRGRWHGAPDISAVPDIVRALKDERALQVVSWWNSFKNWIKQWLDHSNSSIAKWIKHLLEGVLGPTDVSPGILRTFIYLVTILAALAAIIVIVRELKAAGIAARFRRPRSTGQAIASTGGGSNHEELPVDANAPSALLGALVRRLLQMGRLTGERSLTHRELIARASFDNDEQQVAFAGIARLAEILLYGEEPASPEVLAHATRQGRELLRQLSAAQRPA